MIEIYFLFRILKIAEIIEVKVKAIAWVSTWKLAVMPARHS